MRALELGDIHDLRAYERERDEFRRTIIELKKGRRIQLGPVVTVVFENRSTIRFQVQEMARAERMLADSQIQEELDTYNPLIPDVGELSMTVFIELTTEAELREWLPRLVGIEQHFALAVGARPDAEIVRCVVDPAHASQLTRDEVTASVHYVRIVLSSTLSESFRSGPAALLVDHPAYRYEVELPDATRASLSADWTDAAS